MMELAVYACAGNTVLFVPAASTPPPEAHRACGSMRYRGVISADPSASATWREIALQIDRHLFATVGLGEIALLLGSVDAIRQLDGDT